MEPTGQLDLHAQQPSAASMQFAKATQRQMVHARPLQR
jgi:hypothetical protein